MQKEPRNVWTAWQSDLAAARDEDEGQRTRIAFVVRWYLGWAERRGDLPGRESVRNFWSELVLSKSREAWQLEQWETGLRWYLEWIELVRRQEVRAVLDELSGCYRVSAELMYGSGLRLKELLGHKDVTTTEIYTHVAEGATKYGVRSPLDE